MGIFYRYFIISILASFVSCAEFNQSKTPNSNTSTKFTPASPSTSASLSAAGDGKYVDIKWSGFDDHRRCSIDIWVGNQKNPCITSGKVGYVNEFRFDGQCNRNKTTVSISKITKFRLNCALNGKFRDGDIVKSEVAYDGTSSAVSLNFSHDIEISWDTTGNQSEYALGLRIETNNGEKSFIGNCVKATRLGQRTSYRFKGTCPDRADLGNIGPIVTDFVVHAARFGDWKNHATRLKSSSANDSKKVHLSFGKNAVDTFVYVLAGQSNMVGYGGFNRQLATYYPEGHKLPKNVRYIYNNVQYPDFKSSPHVLKLTPGIEFIFGPEVSLAQKLSKQFPDKKILIIKEAVGGTSAKKWLDPDGLIDNLAESVQSAVEGKNYSIKAIFWMQGEADANKGNLNYETDLRNIRKRIRGKIPGASGRSVPFILGRIYDYYSDPNGKRFDGGIDAQNRIRSAQELISSEDSFSSWIDTDSFKLRRRPSGTIDPWHFDGISQLSFGECLFDILQKSLKSMKCSLLSK